MILEGFYEVKVRYIIEKKKTSKTDETEILSLFKITLQKLFNNF